MPCRSKSRRHSKGTTEASLPGGSGRHFGPHCPKPWLSSRGWSFLRGRLQADTCGFPFRTQTPGRCEAPLRFSPGLYIQDRTAQTHSCPIGASAFALFWSCVVLHRARHHGGPGQGLLPGVKVVSNVLPSRVMLQWVTLCPHRLPRVTTCNTEVPRSAHAGAEWCARDVP